MSMQLQIEVEAEKLKQLTNGDTWTKVIAVGVSSEINSKMLDIVASEPHDLNIIRMPPYDSSNMPHVSTDVDLLNRNHSSFHEVEEQIRNICNG